MRAFYFLAIIVASVVGAHAACPVSLTSDPNDVSSSLAITKLSPLLACSAADPINDQSPCNTFAARGLESIYKVADFKTATGYMSANQIFDFVSSSSQWTNVGAVYDEDNNLCAQALANRAFPVVAVMKATGHGHIALVIPGSVGTSDTWKMKAANSASFLYQHPDKAYVGGLLSRSYGVENAKKAFFFYRKQSPI